MRAAVALALLAGALLGRGFAEEEPAGKVVREFERRQLTDVFYCEGAAFGDISGDGVADIVSGPFWYEGPSFEKSHAYYAPKPWDINGYSDNFFAFVEDVSRDGKNDIVIIGFPGQEAYWYENPGPTDELWPRHLILSEVSNESPDFRDIDGDGFPEIVCINGGRYGYARADRDKVREPWKFIAISENRGLGRFTHGMGVGDVDGDGHLDVIEKDGWYEQPDSLEGDPLWTYHAYGFSGPGGSQMYAYDVDGDGDNDVITSLEAHGYGLAWFEHVVREGKIDFERHLITGARVEDSPYGVRFSQPHAVDLVDVDGDGLRDIVTGKRWWAHQGHDPGARDKAVVYWFRLVRGESGADWVPYLIDDVSGVGTQVVAGDIDGDGHTDVVVGNKKGTFVHLQRPREVSEAEWRKHEPRRSVSSGQSGEEAARHMTVPAGFRVELVASEPAVRQPVAFTIDERGRLWVLEGFSYPRRRPEGEGKDDIIILEDGDHDGSFETRKVFAKGINLGSGLEVGFGGVFVGAAPYLLFFPDRDRDDVPDGDPEILLDGFGYHDTHETLNSFQWGPDGWLYGCHGVFTHSRVGKPGTPDAGRVPINAGVWRFHPLRQEFEVFAWGTSNPWGVDFNDYGEAFITACVIPHLYHVIPGARYIRQAGRDFNEYIYREIDTIASRLHHGGARWTPEHFAVSDELGGGHAHCGAMVYLGNNFPEEYRGSIFMNNIHGNRVNIDALDRRGSGWVGRCVPDFLFANDKWFRGIALRYGPDGSVFVTDWYDQQACHLVDPLVWDRSNGRIYNVAWGEPKPVRVDIHALSDEALVELQLHENDWYVRQARRVLEERGPNSQVHARLESLLAREMPAPRRLRVLWALHVTGGITDEITERLLDDRDEWVRAWAVRLAVEDRDVSRSIAARFANLAKSDPSQVVRLALASALQRISKNAAWPVARGLATHAEDAGDHNLPAMLWYGVEPLVAADPRSGLELAESTKLQELSRFIVRRAAADVDRLDPVLASLVSSTQPAFRTAILEEMVRAFEGHAELTMPSNWKAAFDALESSDDAHVRELVRAIAVKFGDRRIFPELRAVVTDRANDFAQRERALAVLLDGGDPELVPVLLAVLSEPALRGAAIRGLARYDDARIPGAILERWSELAPNERADAVSTLASRPSSARALLEAVRSERVARTELSAFVIRQIGSFGDADLSALVTEVWGEVRETSEEKAELIAHYRGILTPEAIAAADPSHGRLVFAKTCAQCHTLYGTGGTIAPDLTGSNRRDLGYLLENVLDPSAVVGKDYQLEIFILRDGRVISGLVKRETETAITVQTVNEEVVVPRAQIVEKQQSSDSMMPEGLIANLEEPDVVALVAYLGTDAQVPMRGADANIDPKTHRVAGVIEGETIRVLEHRGGGLAPQDMRGFGVDEWSGNTQLFWTSPKPNDEIVVAVQVEKAGRYAIDIACTKASDYGVVQFSLDGEDIDAPIDFFAERVIHSGPIRLGEKLLETGEHRLGVRVVGIRPEAVKKYMFGLDWVRLVPLDS